MAQVRHPAPLPTFKLLVGLAKYSAMRLYLLAMRLDTWMSGPPMTTREQARLSSTVSDLHWKYWSRL